MATLTLTDFIDIDTKTMHTATSWQFALDAGFTKIIDESLKDEVNLTEFVSMLPMIDDPSKYYADLDNLYARVKVYIGEDISPWYTMEPKNQNEQTVVVTDVNGVDTIYDAIQDGFK